MGLLSHENADIAAASIHVIADLTDDDVVDQADEALSVGDDDEEMEDEAKQRKQWKI